MNPVLAAGLILFGFALVLFFGALVADLIRYSKRRKWEHPISLEARRKRSTYPAVGVAILVGILGLIAILVGALLALTGLS